MCPRHLCAAAAPAGEEEAEQEEAPKKDKKKKKKDMDSLFAALEADAGGGCAEVAWSVAADAEEEAQAAGCYIHCQRVARLVSRMCGIRQLLKGYEGRK